MAKTMKGAAADSASLLDTITGAQNTRNTKDTQDAQNTPFTQIVKGAQNAPAEKKKAGRPVTVENPARINLKLPTELKEYLSVAAAKASIAQKKTISVTAYICDLIRADMEQNTK